MRVSYGLTAVAFVTAMASANAALAQDSTKVHTSLDVRASGLKTFYVDDRAGGNQVSFSSEAPIEDFTGVCNKVAGQCRLDPRNVEMLVGSFSIRVEDMRTGVDLRDEHMRGADWLDATQYPEIVIDVTSVKDVKKSGANAATLTLVETCALHGKSSPVEIPATLSYLDESPTTMARVKGDLMRLRAEFTVKLSDYQIAGPEASKTIGLKVSDDIHVRCAVYGSTTPPPKPLSADQPIPSDGENKPTPPKRP